MSEVINVHITNTTLNQAGCCKVNIPTCNIILGLCFGFFLLCFILWFSCWWVVGFFVLSLPSIHHTRMFKAILGRRVGHPITVVQLDYSFSFTSATAFCITTSNHPLHFSLHQLFSNDGPNLVSERTDAKFNILCAGI